MCDLIHFGDLLYAWGTSSLGDFLAVQSDRGLVAFEFANRDGNAVRELQARFPDIVLTERPAAMAETIAALARLVDHPDQDPGGRARYPRHRLREESLGAAAANPAGHDDELRRGRRADGHARCPRCDDGDRQQHPGDPDPMPPRREEGWLALRLPLGLDAQARAPRARAKKELKAEAGVSGRRPATIVDDETANWRLVMATENDPRWAQVMARDKSADGTFWYSVQTTGVYCRPSCPSRRANPANVTLHDDLPSAKATGFRPCRRCNPDG